MGRRVANTLGPVTHRGGAPPPQPEQGGGTLKRGRSDEGPEAQRQAAFAEGPRWSLESKVEDVLLERHGGLECMKLPDFLERHFGETYGTANVSMSFFVIDPDRYITDTELLSGILKHDEFQLLEARSYLLREGITDLQQWEDASAEIKNNTCATATGLLQSALNVAKKAEKQYDRSGGRDNEIIGAYESVYNAEWSHVLSGEEHRNEPLGLKVVEGKPELWTWDEVNLFHDPRYLEAPLPRHGNLEIAVLTSKMGWPYTAFAAPEHTKVRDSSKPSDYEFKKDVYIRRETMRMWYYVEKDIGQWEGPSCVVVIGTPGIGKSYGVGSLFLYQLLHYDVEKVELVAYFIRRQAYVFHKPRDGSAARVQVFYNQDKCKEALCRMELKGVKGYTIFDVFKRESSPVGVPITWGTVVLASPDKGNYAAWANQQVAQFVYMDCDHESDLKAFVAWRGLQPVLRGEKEVSEVAEAVTREWEIVKERIDDIGALARYTLNAKDYSTHLPTVESALDKMSSANKHLYAALFRGPSEWKGEDPSHKLAKIVRVIGKGGRDTFRNTPLSQSIKKTLINKIITITWEENRFFISTLSHSAQFAVNFELFGGEALKNKHALEAMAEAIVPLPMDGQEAQASVLQRLRNKCLHENDVLLPKGNVGRRKEIQYMVLYRPDAENFPVVDRLFFVRRPKTLVGLQYTTADRHPTKCSTVAQLKRELRRHFVDWDSFSAGLRWEVIYITPGVGAPFSKWQVCEREGVGMSESEIDAEMTFWREHVHQYALGLEDRLVAAVIEVALRNVRACGDQGR